MNGPLFGTDGIRGTYGEDPITELFASRVAAGLGQYLRRRDGTATDSHSVVMARDTRFSGPALAAAFAQGFECQGIQVIDLGVLPTPQVAFATHHLGASLGLAITASHNPVQDNGYKLFRTDGTKFEADEEAVIEQCIITCEPGSFKPPPANPARLFQATEHGLAISQAYQNRLRAAFSHLRLHGMRIVVDAANGATSHTTPLFLKSLGADVHPVACEPDGHNINCAVGSEHPEMLQQLVKETGADLGVAHDGDGDRVLVVNAEGQLVSGEQVLALLARYSPTLGCDGDHALVTTQMSNFALDAYLKEGGIPVLRTDVGDRNVAVCMRQRGCHLGGENSGHFICADILGSGDGLVAVLKLLETMHATGRSLQELCREVALFPSHLLNLVVSEKRDFASLPTLTQAMREVEAQIEGKGRVLVRYSGTENKLRILVECASDELVHHHLTHLERAARADLHMLT